MGDETKPVQVFEPAKPAHKMTMRDLVRAHLEKHGFDGLAGEDECGCTLRDFAACGWLHDECKPAFKIVPVKSIDVDYIMVHAATRESAMRRAHKILPRCAFCSASEDDEGICDGSGCEEFMHEKPVKTEEA